MEELILILAKNYLIIHIYIYQSISKRHINEKIHKNIFINMKKCPGAQQ